MELFQCLHSSGMPLRCNLCLPCPSFCLRVYAIFSPPAPLPLFLCSCTCVYVRVHMCASLSVCERVHVCEPLPFVSLIPLLPLL